MKLRVPAKINLSLNVVGKRKDGYHDLDMLNARISLYDTLYIKVLKTLKGRLFLATIPEALIKNENNLITKAVSLFRQAHPFTHDLKITLVKAIPVGAGLGGGSCDAAAVLTFLNDYFGKPLDQAALSALALKVGADVPYALMLNPARVQGIGEIISPLPHFSLPLIVVVPKTGVITASCFAALNLTKGTNGQIERLIELLTTGERERIIFYLSNDLQAPALKINPEIGAVIEALQQAGVPGVIMTGAGSAVLGLGLPGRDLKRIARQLKKQYQVHYVKII